MYSISLSSLSLSTPPQPHQTTTNNNHTTPPQPLDLRQDDGERVSDILNRSQKTVVCG
ncbi:hypothetical protein Hanom_Chr06g00533601 [Helianthus anomalus]